MYQYLSGALFCSSYIWPWARNETMQHDSYSCFQYGGSIGFPTEREKTENNFVGAPTFGGVVLTKKCPEVCRRKKDWIFC